LSLALIEHVAPTGDLARQQALVRDGERIAREAGLGAVVDGREPDLGGSVVGQ
jgi:hypothetical protein